MSAVLFVPKATAALRLTVQDYSQIQYSFSKMPGMLIAQPVPRE